MKKITFAERLKEARKSAKLSQEALAKSIGRTKSTISRWESGERNPKMFEMVELEKILGVPAETLLYGTEKITKTTLSEINRISSKLEEPRQQVVLDTAKEQYKEQESEKKKVIPLESDSTLPKKETTYTYYDNAVSAGTGQYLTDGKQEEVIVLPVEYDADFVVPVCGDSMEPEFHDCDYVFVKNTYDLYDGDIGVFILDGEAYIKELRIDEEGAFLHSLNPQYSDKPLLAESDFRIAGKVVGRYNENDKK